MARTVSLRHANTKEYVVSVDGVRTKFTNVDEALLAAMFNAWYRGATLTVAPSVLSSLRDNFGEWTTMVGDVPHRHVGFPLTKL